jgi:glucose/mannose transport system substrate-binding protein
MRATPKKLVAVLATAGLLSLAACGGDSGDSAGEGGGDEVEVFTWWAEGSEKEGLDALVSVFEEQNSDFTFVNGAVAGGAGSDAKNVLASRLQRGPLRHVRGGGLE